MIDLYFWPTPDAWKISIALEELGLAYNLKPVNMGRGEQFEPEFLGISPNNHVPALLDHSPPGGGPPFSSFESGAMLLYLADKTGRLLPTEWRARHNVLPWLMWQISGLAPMLAQHGHFTLNATEQIAYPIERYERETWRLYAVLDDHLGRQRSTGGAYVMGEYSVADIAIFPWIMTHRTQGLSLNEFPNVQRWFAIIRARTAVQRGLLAGRDLPATNPLDIAWRRHLLDEDSEEHTRPQDL